MACFFHEYEESKLEKLSKSEAGLKKIYEENEHRKMFLSYLGMRTLFRETETILDQFFSFAEELRTSEFKQAIAILEGTLNAEYEKIATFLKKEGSLQVSENIMGKTFYHRGPFSQFIYVPSMFLPMNAMRYYNEYQILFYNVTKDKTDHKVLLQQLKTITDNTQMNIISQLNQRGSMCGSEIADTLSLAPSTVSHHIEQLKNAGLLHEEQVKSSKYYSINKNSVNNLLQMLKEAMGDTSG